MSARLRLLLALALLGAAPLVLGRSVAGDAVPGGQPVFQRGTLDFSVNEPTSLAFGPDGRLYVASLTGIHALTLDPATREVVAVEQVADGLVGALGIAFDPSAPAAPAVVYASHQDPAATPGFQGTISTFTGPTWQRDDVITGLPTSAPFLNHWTNGIALDGAGRLFIAQGSATDGGIADPPDAQSYWHETPLSGAILVADLAAPGFDGAIMYDPPGPPADDNVDQVSGDVAVFAAGFRNAYDLVLHSNGYIYAADNGALGKEVSLSCTESGGQSSVADELNLVEEGNYYGFPNRNRGRSDPRQCTYHPPEEPSNAGYTGPLAVLPRHCSCDGIAEYTAPAFGGAMLGDLIYAEWGLRRVSRAQLAEDGRSVASISTLAIGLDQPLDVAVSEDGTIYVAEFSAGTVGYLAPAGTPAPTTTPTPSATAGPTATPTPTPTATAQTATPTATAAGLVGDVNCDGRVTSIDAALVLQLVAGLISTLPCLAGADANADGQVNAIDAALILQVEAGLLPGLPP